MTMHKRRKKINRKAIADKMRAALLGTIEEYTADDTVIDIDRFGIPPQRVQKKDTFINLNTREVMVVEDVLDYNKVLVVRGVGGPQMSIDQGDTFIRVSTDINPFVRKGSKPRV